MLAAVLGGLAGAAIVLLGLTAWHNRRTIRRLMAKISDLEHRLADRTTAVEIMREAMSTKGPVPPPGPPPSPPSSGGGHLRLVDPKAILFAAGAAFAAVWHRLREDPRLAAISAAAIVSIVAALWVMLNPPQHGEQALPGPTVTTTATTTASPSVTPTSTATRTVTSTQSISPSSGAPSLAAVQRRIRGRPGASHGGQPGTHHPAPTPGHSTPPLSRPPSSKPPVSTPPASVPPTTTPPTTTPPRPHGGLLCVRVDHLVRIRVLCG